MIKDYRHTWAHVLDEPRIIQNIEKKNFVDHNYYKKMMILHTASDRHRKEILKIVVLYLVELSSNIFKIILRSSASLHLTNCKK